MFGRCLYARLAVVGVWAGDAPRSRGEKGKQAMSVSHFVKQELARVKEENEALQAEIGFLRNYVDAAQAMMEAIDGLDPRGDLKQALEMIVYNVMAAVRAESGMLAVLDEESGDLVFVVTRGEAAEGLAGRRIPVGKGIAGWVAKNARPVLANNARVDDRFYAGLDQSMQTLPGSILAAPLTGARRVLGVLEVVDKADGQMFNADDQSLVALLCRLAGEFLYLVIQHEEKAANAQPAGVS